MARFRIYSRVEQGDYGPQRIWYVIDRLVVSVYVPYSSWYGALVTVNMRDSGNPDINHVWSKDMMDWLYPILRNHV